MHAHDDEISVALARKVDDLFVRPPNGDEFFCPAPRARVVGNQSLQLYLVIAQHSAAECGGLELDIGWRRSICRPVDDMGQQECRLQLLPERERRVERL